MNLKHKWCAIASGCFVALAGLGGIHMGIGNLFGGQFLSQLLLFILILVFGFFLYYYIFVVITIPFRFIWNRIKGRKK